jgi:acetyltransferase-like isoleucine patch superfamily enzyme
MIHVGNPNVDELCRTFSKAVIESLNISENPFHPLAFINGEPIIGENVCIGFFSEINAKNAGIKIGDYCDIASFVSINVADSHLRSIELAKDIDRKPIIIEHHVFIGSHSFIGGGNHIGHHSVIGAGTILMNKGYIPPFSLIVGNPAVIKQGYFRNQYNEYNSAQ